MIRQPRAETEPGITPVAQFGCFDATECIDDVGESSLFRERHATIHQRIFIF
jgi:hypothetical protein